MDKDKCSQHYAALNGARKGSVPMTCDTGWRFGLNEILVKAWNNLQIYCSTCRANHQIIFLARRASHYHNKAWWKRATFNYIFLKNFLSKIITFTSNVAIKDLKYSQSSQGLVPKISRCEACKNHSVICHLPGKWETEISLIWRFYNSV